ncbi:MAG: exonuclease domain-containing protein [Opitutaceae bacterium]|jgi:DNA polymerase-3 subunit epsilon
MSAFLFGMGAVLGLAIVVGIVLFVRWVQAQPADAAGLFPGWFAVVDVETTALDPERGALLSIGAVVPATGDRYYGECFVRAGALVEPEALAVNGATSERLVDMSLRSEAALVSDFAYWMRKRGIRLIGGKNPSFDQGHLKAAWARANMPGRYPLTHRTVDLHSLAWAWALRNRPEVLNADGIKSDELYVMMGMEPEPKPHNALVGALVELDAFRFLIYGRTAADEIIPRGKEGV